MKKTGLPGQLAVEYDLTWQFDSKDTTFPNNMSSSYHLSASVGRVNFCYSAAVAMATSELRMRKICGPMAGNSCHTKSGYTVGDLQSGQTSSYGERCRPVSVLHSTNVAHTMRSPVYCSCTFRCNINRCLFQIMHTNSVAVSSCQPL